MPIPADIDMEFLITLALVFVAIVVIAIVAVKTLAEAMKASEEEMDIVQMSMTAGGAELSPLTRFISPGRLFRLRVITAAVPGVLMAIVLLAAGITKPFVILPLAAVFAFVGWKLPLMYFNFLIKRRQVLFEFDILDFTLGLDNALRAGMALPQALEKISARMHGPMREELETVQREYRLGVDLVHALDHLCRRMPCEDLKLLTSAIRITSEAGGSLSEVLHEMTQMIRGRREFQDKVKALTAEGRFEAIAMSLAPAAAFVFMSLIQADLMKVLYTTTLGWCALGVVAALEIAGYFVINKIVTIEV
jgi:tight adherence protein B